MTLPDVERIFLYWKKSPPLGYWAMAIAAALGVKVPEQGKSPDKQYMTEADLDRLLAMTGGAIPGVGQR